MDDKTKKYIVYIGAFVVLLATVLGIFLERFTWHTAYVVDAGTRVYYVNYNPLGRGYSYVYGTQTANPYYYVGVELIPGIMCMFGAIYVYITDKKGDLLGVGIMALGIGSYLLLLYLNWAVDIDPSTAEVISNPYWSSGTAGTIEYKMQLGLGFFLTLAGCIIGMIGALLERKD